VRIGAQKWVHLRTCQSCGATLCCDSSPNRHASKHARGTGHPVIASGEPGERWLYWTAILSGDSGGGNIGIGFAVPINTIKALLPQLRGGQVHRGRLRVRIRSAPITEEEGKALGLPKPEGALVMAVDPGSPAEEGGLRAGDVIVEFNGSPIADAGNLTSRVASTAAGARASIAYYRDNTRRTATVNVEELKD
jgi:serine protease Do